MSRRNVVETDAAAECVKRTKTGGQKKPNSFGCVAQLVRALRSHRRGRWFESNHIHQDNLLYLHIK